MKRLSSYLADTWVEGEGSHREIHDAVSGAVMAEVSTAGLDLGAALTHAREVGGTNLRSLTFAERGAILKQLSRVVVEARDELLELSRQNYGATRRDGKFDVDGASGTLSYYAYLGKKLGDRTFLLDGEAENVLNSRGLSASTCSFLGVVLRSTSTRLTSRVGGWRRSSRHPFLLACLYFRNQQQRPLP